MLFGGGPVAHAFHHGGVVVSTDLDAIFGVGSMDDLAVADVDAYMFNGGGNRIPGHQAAAQKSIRLPLWRRWSSLPKYLRLPDQQLHGEW